ncbi:MAG: FxsA family protein [Kangiellaceae bacterium]|nr:FxsA family protein [Kangiellaceae bacterium]
MFRFLIFLFILVPIIEIGVFIQVGDVIGLGWTLIIVVATAVLGVNLLKQQGFKAWQDIQLSMAKGNMPATEMAAAAQLLFAGGLLLTPGFVTDAIGFTLMIPQLRLALASKLISAGTFKAASFNDQSFNQQNSHTYQHSSQNDSRTIEGEFENKDKS